jgi:type I restriction enzyme S subunit
MSEPRLSGLNDEQDLGTQKILKSLNQAKPDADNMKKGNAPSLPKGWEIKKLGEVVDIINGRNQSAVISENGQYPIYGSAGNLMGFATDYLCEEGTTIIGRKGNISNPIYIEEKFWNVDTAFGLHPKNGYNPKFINYLCQTIDFKSRNRGTTIPSLVKSDLLSIDVPFISSLPEQQRIVSILDECFSVIERSRNNAEQNLKNAKELFESYLQGVFEKKGDDWEEKRLGEVLVKTETVDPTKNPDTEFTYLDVSSVNKETKEIETPTVLLGKDAPSRAKKLIKTGDVIFATVRPTHSRVALIPEEFDEQVCSTGYFVLRSKDTINNKLIFYFLLTKGFNEQMEKLQKGASYPAVTDNDVKGILFRFPKTKTEQQTIVRQLDALRAETQKLEAVYQKKIDDLEELKKSILQKAFAGELKMSEPLINAD